ncbi:hypothetical protein ARAM_000797 [Aspergillus rambellii]|uniref:Uncharacterized protein n=1 Tax=Aspergillus rambellii TaxID=308745 RepID=A0A0F8U3I9_9EURO|nr:hypothetical protein ARAM_000797 [Aspergillus rambellii]
MNTLKRLALGQPASIGALYDARKDTFLNESLLCGEIPQNAIVSTAINRAETTLVRSGNVREKFEKLDVAGELGASLLAGLVAPRGSARYLSQQGDSLPTAQRAVIHTISTKLEQLSFMTGNIRDILNLGVLATSKATHVLTGITWGTRVVVSTRTRVTADASLSQCEKLLDSALEGFMNPVGAEDSWLDLPTAAETGDSIHVRLFTDAKETLDGPVDNLADAMEHFNEIKSYTETTGGKPLMYTLLPIAFLVTLGAVVPNDAPAGQLSQECYDKLVGLFDHFSNMQQALKAHHQRLMQHKALVNETHLSAVEDHMKKAQDAESSFRARYASTLSDIRHNQATSQTLLDIIVKVHTSVLSSQDLKALIDTYDKKLDFLSKMVGYGAVQVGDPKMSLKEVIEKESSLYRTIYAFHFNNKVLDLSDTWKENRQLLEELLAKTNPKPHVLLIDCDTHEADLTQAYITVYANGGMVVENLLEQNKELAGKHLVKYDQTFLESTNDVPAYRKTLRAPCPGPYCDGKDICVWVCCDCHETIEFGSRDGYFYCDCGRVPFDRVGFNCQRQYHKSGYFEFDRDYLRDLLQNLPAPREVNILILGETGVGKSTFVNAFVNYLTFGSLDDGLKNPKLNCIIPCSFTTQVVDEEGRMISKDVVIGSDNDEVDGSKGQSATQKATVYPLYFRDTLIRLIDTPGIGDTRGLEQDKQNMANMLSILRNYPALHGILILLKPNNARLGVMFRFCVKELLTHLHTSAAQNMVFGFTNTRGSNYTPGDTFKPLESLLSEYHNVIPQLSRSNVYCFDSESFRYLAARNKGIDIGHIDDYRRSWEHSSKEADRLLAHFQSLHPHHTQETLSLNETRHLIAQLTAPMQQISVAITDTIAKSKQQVKDLKHAKLTGDDLRAKLHIHKITVKAEQLTRPKTVCSNENCVESVFDEGSNSEVLLRKKLCHDPCCLKNVPVGKVGTPELEHCAAFADANCTICGHHWREHEHILVEYSKNAETRTDPNVQRELTTHGNEIKAKEKAIQALRNNIVELKQEHTQIQTAAAKFSLYLKQNSITHYNDATIEYLEHLIKDERTKVRTGQSRQRLESLEKDLDNYKKFVDTMEQGKDGSDSCETYIPLNEAGVAKLVQTLYNLPHYGQMLKDLAQVVANAYEANFRERPYRISRKKYWREYRDAQAQNRALGRRTSVRKSGWGWKAVVDSSSSGAVKHPGRALMPGDSNSPAAQLTEKLLPNPSHDTRQPNRRSDFWPSENQGSFPNSVQSILAGTASPALGPNAGATPNRFRSSSLPRTAPPPYPGPALSPHTLNTARNNGQVKVVERKGVWLRLKGKLSKK